MWFQLCTSASEVMATSMCVCVCLGVRTLGKSRSSLFCVLLVFSSSKSCCDIVTVPPEARSGVAEAAKDKRADRFERVCSPCVARKRVRELQQTRRPYINSQSNYIIIWCRDAVVFITLLSLMRNSPGWSRCWSSRWWEPSAFDQVDVLQSSGRVERGGP